MSKKELPTVDALRGAFEKRRRLDKLVGAEAVLVAMDPKRGSVAAEVSAWSPKGSAKVAVSLPKAAALRAIRAEIAKLTDELEAFAK